MSTAIATTGSHKTNGSSASVYSNEAKHIDKIEILGKNKNQIHASMFENVCIAWENWSHWSRDKMWIDRILNQKLYPYSCPLFIYVDDVYNFLN